MICNWVLRFHFFIFLRYKYWFVNFLNFRLSEETKSSTKWSYQFSQPSASFHLLFSHLSTQLQLIISVAAQKVIIHTHLTGLKSAVVSQQTNTASLTITDQKVIAVAELLQTTDWTEKCSPSVALTETWDTLVNKSMEANSSQYEVWHQQYTSRIWIPCMEYNIF